MARRLSSYVRLTLAQKQELCAKASVEPNWSSSELDKWATNEFMTASSVGRSTVRGILKRKDDFCNIPEAHGRRKRLCSTTLRASDKHLMRRIQEFKVWHANGTVTGARVFSLAKVTEGVLGGTSRGWLYKFQLRNGLWFSQRHDEGGLLDAATVAKGRQDLRAAVAQYNPQDVYNMDETSFFYRREPRGTLTTDKNEKGKKQSKLRITVCVATKADGTDRLPLHFIGTSKVPRPLKDRNVFAELGVTYTNTTKAWMTTNKYCEWLQDLNTSMQEQQRHILLLVDNVATHNDSSIVLSNIRVHKLPPNTTAALQPMDQGIIKSLKDHYQDEKGEAELQKFLNGEKYEPVDLYSAMQWCSEGWKSVSSETIRNCWCHTGFISKMNMGYLLN